MTEKTQKEFQSTPPVKAATCPRVSGKHQRSAFQSTPPVKAATLTAECWESGTLFQSTPPVKAATRVYDVEEDFSRDFNPRRP